MPTFTKGINYDGTNIDGGLIYANGPENIGDKLLDTAAFGRAFTYYKLEKNKIYEAEYYKWNYSNKKIWVGVALFNNTTSENASVTILKRSTRFKRAAEITPITGNNPSCNVGADMTLGFMNSNDQSNPVIRPTTDYSSGGCYSLIETHCPEKGLANGRVRFKVNSGSNLYCKIYAVQDINDTNITSANYAKRAGWANIVSAKDLTETDPGKPSNTYNATGGYTGVYPNIQRYAAITNTNAFRFAFGKYAYNSSEKKDVVVDNLGNTNEFEIPKSTLPFSKIGNQGNYGIVYAFYNTNPNARKVTIIPRQVNKGRFVAKVNGIWRYVDYPSSSSWSNTFTLNGGTSFWFVLAGGNYGDVEIKYSLV